MDYTVIIFGLPLTGISYDEYKDIIKAGYIGNENIDSDEPNTIYITTKNNPNRLQQLQKQHTTAKTRTIIGGDTVVGAEILPEFVEDYRLFLEGKYSRMSEKAKTQVKQRTAAFGDYATRVFNKDKELLKSLVEKYAITRNYAGELSIDKAVEKEILNLGEVLERPQAIIKLIKNNGEN